MKRAASIALAAAICLGSAVSAFASSTEFSYVHQNDPTYTITIPSAIDLAKDGSDVEIEASDVANLGDKVISVTIEGTDASFDQFSLEAKDIPSNQTTYSRYLAYAITTESGEWLQFTGRNPYIGTELVSFTDNGTKSFRATPVITDAHNFRPDTAYTGTLTYGIELV